MKKRLSAEVRKPEILSHFYEVIIEEGFENASIQKVAKRMGIHPSLIIHYFESKENMVLGLVDLVLESHSNLFGGLPAFESEPQKRLRGILETIWSQDWHTRINTTVVYAVLSMSCRNSRVFERILNLYTSYKLYLKKEFTRFYEAGIISGIDPENAADIIISMSEGSHYFMPFHIKHNESDAHRKRMINAALKLLNFKDL